MRSASIATRPPARPRTRSARLVFLALAGLTLVAGAAWSARSARRSVTWTSRTMGTYVRIGIVTTDSTAAAPTAAAGLAVFPRVDSLMTNWTSISEVARLNREASARARIVQPEVARVLDASLRIWRESDGTFDITVEPLIRAWGFLGGPRRVPTESELAAARARVGAGQLQFDPLARTLRYQRDGVKIDLGGIAKGYAVDAAAETLAARHVTDALVDLSGNMFALGSPPGARGWRIGIRDPRDRIPWLGRVTISDQGISTSGQYEQFVAEDGRTYGHIMDPRTGRPAEGLISVTVIAPSALDSDGWDTPLFVLGPEAARRKARLLEHVTAILVQPGTAGVDTMWVEESLRGRFVLEPRARAFIELRYF